MDENNSVQRLHAKIDAMDTFLDLDSFIRDEKNSLEEIRSYYRINEWAYKHFHSHNGFMHFRISPNGVFADDDIYHQPDAVSAFIKADSIVAELGFGQGANLLYLARRHPDARFIGVDLSPLKAKDVPQNVTTYQQDYSSLPQLKDNSLDVMYAFETIVHNTDKEKIYREACRVLKPGGVMIVYDYALSAAYTAYDPHTQKAIALISKGCASAMIESLDELNSHYTNSGLLIERRTDYSLDILPDLKRLDRLAAKVLRRPRLAKFIFRVLPDQFVSNIIVGYLGHDSFKAGVITYHEWILKKP